MSIFDFFRLRSKQPTAVVAKERLQIVLAHERADSHSPEYLPRLKNEILQVIGRYVAIEEEKLAIRLETAGSTSILEVNIELPSRTAIGMAGQGGQTPSAANDGDRAGAPATAPAGDAGETAPTVACGSGDGTNPTEADDTPGARPDDRGQQASDRADSSFTTREAVPG